MYSVYKFSKFVFRLSCLLLLLPTLRTLSASATEELFFVGLIGSVQIDSIIPYILRMDSSEFSLSGVVDPSSPGSESYVDPSRELSIPNPFPSEKITAIIHTTYGGNGLLNDEPKTFSSVSQSGDSLLPVATSVVSSS